MNKINSLIEIENIDKGINSDWLKYLYYTNEKNYNVLNVKSLKDINSHSVLSYVSRTLEVLNEINANEKLDKDTLYYVEEVLKWSDVAKCGSKEDRKEWKKKGYDLFCHNVGSSEIYSEKNNDYIVKTLIRTHGLVGQYIKGEINLSENLPLYNLIKEKKISKEKLQKVLEVLNKCIIEGVSKELYSKVENNVYEVINRIINGDIEERVSVKERLIKLNGHLPESDLEYLEKLDKKVVERLEELFDNVEIWYFNGALNSFSIDEQIKILLLASKSIKGFKHLTFENLMHILYLDYKDKKEINIYKKRIIENYLKELNYTDILNNNISPNPHITYSIKKQNHTLIFNFNFSKVAKKLIEFCELAGNSNVLYQKATYMLYDLFGFRRDSYDRFYNELDYLATMNSSQEDKSVLLNYIVGKKVLDVGPGGGVMLDMIEKANPSLDIYGIDLSQNVIDTLSKKKIDENHSWNIVKGDALNLNDYFEEGSIDSIIYSSIIHELFSYITFEGKKFNHNTIKKSLEGAYKLLSKGGRIIIRDGIMTTPKDMYRLIEFKNVKDLEILDRYCNDFKGRKVTYELINKNTVKMLVNDAMEFLYTYTWGEESYPLEVQEQFGYFDIREYVSFIKEALPGCIIVEAKSFLQEGYEINLLPKISIYDENRNVVKLPDSTCIIVIEKE